MHLHDYVIISQNKQDNFRLCISQNKQDNFRLCIILDYLSPKIYCRHCYKILPYLTINTTSSKKINTTSRSGTRRISIKPCLVQ